MTIPFCLGKVIDIIYMGENHEETKRNLDKVCLGLLGIFLIGGLCNFGRVYLMQVSGTLAMWLFTVFTCSYLKYIF